MNTNFFSQIAQLDITGQLQLTITKGAGNNLVVAVMLNNEHCGDDAKNLITPFVLRETAGALDEGFFQTIASPIEQTSTLLNSMENYLKQLEEAKKASAMEKQKEDTAKKEREARDKKYKDAMQKADELDKGGKPREAWMKLPNLADYPEHADDIRKRSAALSAKFSSDLFASPAMQPVVAESVQSVAPPMDALYPNYQNGQVSEEQDDHDQWKEDDETEDY